MTWVPGADSTVVPWGREGAEDPHPRPRHGPWTLCQEHERGPGQGDSPDRALFHSGHCWTRTSDPYDVNVVLYQLS